jgi:peptide/nickel transport system substrate-binding protein
MRHTDKSLGSELGTYFGSVKSVAATGPNDVTIRLKAPDPAIPYFVALAYILKKSFAEPLGKKYALAGGKMIGTGSLTLQNFGATGITLVRNPHYWGKRPPVETVKVSYITDPQTQELAMRSGSIDAVFTIQPTDAAAYQKIAGVNVIAKPGGLSYFLSFDVKSEPWSDIHVRRAVAHCWDGAAFVKGPLRGLGQVSNGMVFPWQWRTLLTQSQLNAFFKSLPSYPFSVAAAKAELAKSAVPNGFSATISYPTAFSNYGLALQSIAANLQQIGIKLTVKEATTSQWLNVLYGHTNLGMAAVAYGPDYPDPHDFLSISYVSSAAAKNGFNFANFKNKTVDRLLKLESAATQPAKRAKYMQQIYRISATQLPYLGLWYDDAVMAIRRPFRYTGWTPEFAYEPMLDYLKTG